MRWLNTIIDSVDMNLSKLWKIRRLGKPGLLHSTGSHRVGHDLATEQQEEGHIKKEGYFPLESRDINFYWTKQKIPGDILNE